MQELDGLSTLKEIIFFDPKAKVIMCSACCSSNIVNEALNLGAIDFISKPSRPDELGKIITKYL